MSSSNNKMVPEVRFKGFSDAWEQRKLGDLAETSYGGGTPRTTVVSYWNGEIPWIQSSDLVEHQISYVNIKKKITEEGLKNSATKLVPKNSIAIVTRVGIGKIALIPYRYTTSQDFLSLSYLKVNELFGTYALYQKLQREINRVQGTSIKGITKKEILQKDINVPTKYEEQEKIGEFLEQLDDTITLHQRKLDLLKQMKQGFMQVMFPQKGEYVPELRFDGFMDKWEVYKLEDILSLLKDGTHGTHKDVEEGPHLLSAKNIKEGRIQIFSDDRKISEQEFEKIHKNFQLMSGDVLLTIVGSIGETAILKNEKNITFQRSVAYLRPLTIDSQFLYTIISGASFQRELKNKQVVSAQPGIYLGDLSRIEITIPEYKAERKKISYFFKKIDETIAFRKQKIERLKTLKKLFLQKMFI